MAIHSAGLLMYRKQSDEIEFFLVHPGGPFWAAKNEGAWSIPKGLPQNDEELLQAAQREFFEETGITPSPPYHSLGNARLKSGKIIHAWIFNGEWNASDGIISNYIEIEWPPRSKKILSIPEVDRGEWMNFEKACIMINPGQRPFLETAKKITL